MSNDKTLEIVIKNTKPIGLVDLTTSLLGLNNQYLRFLDANLIPYDHTKKTLFVKELRSGSAIIELGTTVVYAIPVIQNFNTLYEFSKNLYQISEYFLGNNDEKPNLTKKDILDISNFYELTASDPRSSVIINMHGNGNIINYSGTESAAIQNGARKELEKISEYNNITVHKQLLTFYQARFDDPKIGTLAVIEGVSTKPLKVIFDNKEIQQSMMSNHDGFSKPWQKLAYIVDAEVQTINGEPKLYKIIRYYDDEIIDPE